MGGRGSKEDEKVRWALAHDDPGSLPFRGGPVPQDIAVRLCLAAAATGSPRVVKCALSALIASASTADDGQGPPTRIGRRAQGEGESGLKGGDSTAEAPLDLAAGQRRVTGVSSTPALQYWPDATPAGDQQLVTGLVVGPSGESPLHVAVASATRRSDGGAGRSGGSDGGARLGRAAGGALNGVDEDPKKRKARVKKELREDRESWRKKEKARAKRSKQAKTDAKARGRAKAKRGRGTARTHRGLADADTGNAVDSDPWMLGVGRGDPHRYAEVIRILISRGFQPSATNAAGQTAWDVASTGGRRHLKRALGSSDGDDDDDDDDDDGESSSENSGSRAGPGDFANDSIAPDVASTASGDSVDASSSSMTTSTSISSSSQSTRGGARGTETSTSQATSASSSSSSSSSSSTTTTTSSWYGSSDDESVYDLGSSAEDSLELYYLYGGGSFDSNSSSSGSDGAGDTGGGDNDRAVRDDLWPRARKIRGMPPHLAAVSSETSSVPSGSRTRSRSSSSSSSSHRSGQGSAVRSRSGSSGSTVVDASVAEAVRECGSFPGVAMFRMENVASSARHSHNANLAHHAEVHGAVLSTDPWLDAGSINSKEKKKIEKKEKEEEEKKKKKEKKKEKEKKKGKKGTGQIADHRHLQPLCIASGRLRVVVARSAPHVATLLIDPTSALPLSRCVASIRYSRTTFLVDHARGPIGISVASKAAADALAESLRARTAFLDFHSGDPDPSSRQTTGSAFPMAVRHAASARRGVSGVEDPSKGPSDLLRVAGAPRDHRRGAGTTPAAGEGLRVYAARMRRGRMSELSQELASHLRSDLDVYHKGVVSAVVSAKSSFENAPRGSDEPYLSVLNDMHQWLFGRAPVLLDALASSTSHHQ